MSEEAELGQIERLLLSFVEDARLELSQRWEKWTIDLSQRETHEVVGGLLARQTSLACQFARCPDMWNPHIAPIILRAMADAHISLAWILKDPYDRSRKFIAYGLGQAVLELDHLKAQTAGREGTPDEKALIEASEAWINSQRFVFLTEVKVGSWSDISTRQMADESGCVDFYNHVYAPFSAAAHSMWHHVAKYNLKHCANPLHQYHRVPTDPDLFADPGYMYLAAQYLDLTFRAFDAQFAIRVNVPSAYDHLSEGFASIGARSSETETEVGDRVEE